MLYWILSSGRSCQPCCCATWPERPSQGPDTVALNSGLLLGIPG